MSFDQALQVIENNGGKVLEDKVVIKTQKPETVRFEESFEGLWPKPLLEVRKDVLTVKGKRLVCTSYFSGGVSIEGVICSVSFEGEGDS